MPHSILRMPVLILVFLTLIALSPLPPDFDPARVAARQIDFAGIIWTVDAGGFQDGNHFSDAQDAVWVDADKRLHLTIRKVNGTWYGSQITSLSNAHYGPHRFQVTTVSPYPTLDNLDPNVVLGLFLYEKSCSKSYCVREVDHEFSRWNLPTSPLNAQFVVQPSTLKTRYQYAMALGGATTTTHVIDWHEGYINFASYLGTDHNNPASLLKAWSYTGAYIPTELDYPLIILDFWVNDLDKGNVPAANQEVIISDVEISTLCRPAADIACGQMVSASTVPGAYPKVRDQIDAYRDSTWPEYGPEVAFAYKAQSDGRVTLQLSNHPSDLDLFVISNNADNKCYSTNQAVTHGNEVASFDATAGQTYYVAVDSWGEGGSRFDLTVDCSGAAPPADPEKVFYNNYFPVVRR
ncbi:MAG TPA: PPC domain-containing protein [Anaerolineaceae bacterium]|nr:PPC domain-containing protein [Anaerolineaceae bacterium]